MNILQIIPGSGGSFYCGNCLRDSKFVEALRSEGHQVVKIPMYLPLFADEHDIKDIPVFYGAVSIYLKQLYPIFRKAPAWFDRLLNSGPVLKLAASMAGSTRAEGLEDMTISMLLGEDGKQKEELDRMVDWISENCKPDIIHISNALLLGLAHQIREKIKVPIVCSLQDEDVWVDVMHPQVRDKVWALMAEKSEDVDAFIAVSNYFADVMKKQMAIPENKLKTIYLGVDASDYQCTDIRTRQRNIGFISRLCHENGLDILVDAFIGLKKLPGFDDVKLIMTGGATGDDSKFIKVLKRKLRNNGLGSSYEILDDFEGQGRIDFFERVSVVSVPVRNGEAFGMYLLESMASGVPVVQPELGAFPEIIMKSGGGVTYTPNESSGLTKSLAAILSDISKLETLSRNARIGVAGHFNIHSQAKQMISLFRELLNEY
jgi:glycosyltransferase involved in cell wall biosynthesis